MSFALNALELMLEKVQRNSLALHFKTHQAHALSWSAISHAAGSFKLVLEQLDQLVSSYLNTSQAHA